MARREYWIGSVGPLFYDDTDPVSGGSGYQAAVVADSVRITGTPTSSDEAVPLGELDLRVTRMAVADIESPTELDAQAGSEAGSLVQVFEALSADNDRCTLYMWDSSPGAADPPSVVQGSGGRWIAIAGHALVVRYKRIFTQPMDLHVSGAALGTTDGMQTLSFADAADNNGIVSIGVPGEYKSGGDVKVRLVTCSSAAGTGNVRWQVGYKWVVPGATEAQTVTNLAATESYATAKVVKETEFTIPGSSDYGAVLALIITRLGTDALDTLTQAVLLLGVHTAFACDRFGGVSASLRT